MTEPNKIPVLEEINEPVPIEEVTDLDLVFLNERLAEYREKGYEEAVAQSAANKDLEDLKAKREKVGLEIWSKLVKETKADKLLYDTLIQAFARYTAMYDKQAKPKTIRFKLDYETTGTVYNKKGELMRIASASLVLRVNRTGVDKDNNWFIWNKKTVSFQHVREMRDGHGWKLRLCEELFFDLCMNGITFKIMSDDYRTNHPEVSPTAGGDATKPT